MQNNFISEKYLGYQQLTSLTAAQKLKIPPGTKMLLAQPEVQGVRWLIDNDAGNLSSSNGYPLGAGNELRFTGTMAQMQTLSFIGQAAGAILNVTYFANGEY